MQLAVDVVPYDGRCVLIRLMGEVDLHTAPLLAAALRQATAAAPRVILADFANVSYMSGAGICALAETGDAISQKGGELVIVGAHDEVLDVIKLAGLPGEMCRTASPSEAALVSASGNS
jgi:anti-sigma B factor antagonist